MSETNNKFQGGPVPGVYVHPKEVGRLVKEFMVKHGNTVTIHDVRAELNAAGIVGYSQVSFDKWYERLFVKPAFDEPKPAPKPKTAAPVPPTDDQFPADKKLRQFVKFVQFVKEIGGIEVAERYLKAMRQLEGQDEKVQA